MYNQKVIVSERSLSRRACQTKRGELLRPSSVTASGDASEKLRRQLLAADALVVALYGCRLLALALGGRLFVELARPQFGQQARLFDRALETAKRGLEGLVFADADTRHLVKSLEIGGCQSVCRA